MGGPGLLAATLFVDRTGKGIRTAPRDALISLSSDKQTLGTSFAVHRALDTCGAMIGPLVGFGVLALIPNGFDVVFLASLCFALIGLGVLTLFVENVRAGGALKHTQGTHKVPLSVLWRVPRFKFLVAAAAALGLTTISDAFLYLTLQHRLTFAATFIPLLYVGTSLVYFVLALPAGRLADRFGRGRVFVAGYTLLLAIYCVLLLPAVDSVALIGCLLLFGAFYAATDGVLMALAGPVLPEQLRTTGIAIIQTGQALCYLVSSVLFGLAWQFWGAAAACQVAAAAVVVTIGASSLVLRSRAV
jgi:predicted MFS family arabinose efflux permease